MRRRTTYIVSRYAKTWPREVFDIKEDGRHVSAIKDALSEPGVYVLYREDQPYYIGKTSGPLFNRIWAHANRPHDKRYNYWNFFSVFIVPNAKHRDEVEGILIAGTPTSNSAQPRFPRLALPARIGTLLRKRRAIIVRSRDKTDA
jgi:hypothetical protein